MIQIPDREALLSKDMFTSEKKFSVILSILSTLNNGTIKQRGLAELHHHANMINCSTWHENGNKHKMCSYDFFAL